MKKQIRSGVFETNSSSVHSLTICSNEEYDKWKKGEVLFSELDEKFATREEIIEELKKNPWYSDVNWDDEYKANNILSNSDVKTYEKFFENEWFETFEQHYTTPGGDEVVAFGYYEHD